MEHRLADVRMNRSRLAFATFGTNFECNPTSGPLSWAFGEQNMTPESLVDHLVALFPDFREYWDHPSNGFRDDDGTFTLHGVFAWFSGFFSERFKSLPANRVAALGAFVLECMASADTDLDNAAATCFVENVAGDECDRELAKHLIGEALKYWQAWGGRAEQEIEPKLNLP